MLWVWNEFRYIQLTGLFIAGMLIGRSGIHRDPHKMVCYSRKWLPYSAAFFTFFYGIVLLLPCMGVSGFALDVGRTLFKSYANLGQMMIYICGITLLYYKTRLRGPLDTLAPVGRMSVTNYMIQGFIGVGLFYAFGIGLSLKLSFLMSVFVGIGIFVVQAVYSRWWIGRFYYGPMEWLWRVLTWFRIFPMRREKAS